MKTKRETGPGESAAAEIITPEIMPAGVSDTQAIEAIQRAEIDIQISTAHRFPRSLAKVKADMLALATLDEETAAGCFYTLPARKGGDGKPIQGPSARMAEIALFGFGNIRGESRVVANDGKKITARAVVHDLERNVAVAIEVNRRITTKDGYTFSEDMQTVTGNAACSIALRNATFKVVPLALVKPVYDAARRVAVGDAKTLEERRAKAVSIFEKMGVEKARVLAAVSVPSVADIGPEELETLLGYYTAIKDGDAKIDDVFPPLPRDIRRGDESQAPKVSPVPPAQAAQASPASPPAQPPAPPAAGDPGGLFGESEAPEADREAVVAALEKIQMNNPGTFAGAMRKVKLSPAAGWQDSAPLEGLRRVLALASPAAG